MLIVFVGFIDYSLTDSICCSNNHSLSKSAVFNDFSNRCYYIPHGKSLFKDWLRALHVIIHNYSRRGFILEMEKSTFLSGQLPLEEIGSCNLWGQSIDSTKFSQALYICILCASRNGEIYNTKRKSEVQNITKEPEI